MHVLIGVLKDPSPTVRNEALAAGPIEERTQGTLRGTLPPSLLSTSRDAAEEHHYLWWSVHLNHIRNLMPVALLHWCLKFHHPQ